MKLFFLFIFFSFQVSAQTINTRVAQLNINDSLLFFNKKLVLINRTKKNRVDLSSSIDSNYVNYPMTISSNQLMYCNDSVSYPVKIGVDPEYKNEWVINVDMGHPFENFNLNPMYCDGKYLVLNYYGVKKVRKEKIVKYGLILTQIYLIK